MNLPTPTTLLDRRTLRQLRRLVRPGSRRPSPTFGAEPPAFVICGVEHSGTTLLSDIFRQVPGVGSGFETGVLLADAPSDFPGMEHFEKFAENWNLGSHDVEFICDTSDFTTFYRRLAQRAGILSPDANIIFDKTPRYLVALKDVLGRVQAPFIATYKDPRAILHSSWIRAGRPPLLPWLDQVEPERLGYLLSLYEQHQIHRMERRVLFMPLERLCLAAGTSCEQIFDHAGLRFDPRFLVLRGIDNRATHGSSIQAGQPFGYRLDWNPTEIRQIELRFAALQGWFYS